MIRSKSPLCTFWVQVGACGNSVEMPMPISAQDLATISNEVFQSVQPVGQDAFQPPSLVPSGST